LGAGPSRVTNMRFFESYELKQVSDALEIAEDATGNYYKFSADQWKRHGYDVKTLRSLQGEEISQRAFALLHKATRSLTGFESKTRVRDFYFICLQDHLVLGAMKRDRNLGLLPLMVYVLTHELVHIVRFCNFYQRFTAPQGIREREEALVHRMTFEILENISLPRLDYVLDSYREHAICGVTVL